MKYAPYPAYKQSGVEWLGMIPEEWSALDLKFGVQIELSNIDKHSVEGEPEVLLCNYTDVYKNDRIVAGMPFMQATASEEQIKRLSLKEGDVIITKDSETPDDIGVSAYVKETKENLVCGYHLCLIRPDPSIISGRMLHWYFSSHTAKSYFFIEAVGMTRYALGKYAISNTIIPLPPLPTQRAIATFLDTETARIDGLIYDYEELVVLLQEKRQALISHAVTRGLSELVSADDPEFGEWAKPVTFKHSGVEWIGEIPEGWEAGALCYYARITTGATPNRAVDKYWNGNIPWLKTGEVTWKPIYEAEEFVTEDALVETAVKLADPGTLLMAMYGQGVTRGRVSVMRISASYNQACAAITLDDRIEEQYALYFFMAAYPFIRDDGNETSQMNLSADAVSRIKIIHAPKLQQQAIASFLDKQTATMDTLVSEAKSAIELLKEHRSALITNAVTGKINVETMN